MKKSIVIIIISALVIITGVIWFINSPDGFTFSDLVPIAVIVLLVGFVLYLGIKKLGSLKRGEPAEDELTKKMLTKASSLSYYISLYMWLIVMYFADKGKYESHIYLSAGIVGMAVIFALCWVFINLTGFRKNNE